MALTGVTWGCIRESWGQESAYVFDVYKDMYKSLWCVTWLVVQPGP